MPDRAQVVVVGGGIIGCSVAYHLARRGITDVLLLEQGRLTGGTTWHAAGLVSQLKSSHSLTRLATYSARLFEDLEAETGQATGYRAVGSISVASDYERWEEIMRGLSMARTVGVEMREMDFDELRERWPLIRIDDLVGAAWIPQDGQTSPVDTTISPGQGGQGSGGADRRGSGGGIGEGERRAGGGSGNRTGVRGVRNGGAGGGNLDPPVGRHRRCAGSPSGV